MEEYQVFFALSEPICAASPTSEDLRETRNFAPLSALLTPLQEPPGQTTSVLTAEEAQLSIDPPGRRSYGHIAIRHQHLHEGK